MQRPIDMVGPGHALKHGCVSVVIKALNEEKRIATAVESALAAVSRVGGEVILADSCSTDQTVNIAKQYPITIVQLENPDEKCCGIGPQLGFQYVGCEYVYILDGDMRMHEDFLEHAVAAMVSNPRVAGVGGRVVEQNLTSLEFLARVERASDHMQVGFVDRLDMGGLYRTRSVLDAGYLSDRNLHSYEELDLAMRLRAQGWRLLRIAADAVDHHGHDTPPYRLLVKRWTSRYIWGAGEVLRAGFGKPHMRLLLHDLKEVRLYLMVLLWMVVVFVGVPLLVHEGPMRAGVMLAMLTVPWLILLARKRSARKAHYGLVSWIAHAAGMLAGMFARRTDPHQPVKCRVLARGEFVVAREASGAAIE